MKTKAKMRYKITKEFRNILKLHQNDLLKEPIIGSSIKNIIYKNQSLSQYHLYIIKSLISSKTIPILEPMNLFKEKNLGKYSKSEEIILKRPNKNLAEFIGIMLGDGNIHGNNVRITIDKREEKYKNYIKGLFRSLFKVEFHEWKDKSSNQLKLSKCNKELANLLVKYGLKRGNKLQNNVGIPQWIKKERLYSRSCLRGLIDTDGCVYWCKRDKRVYIKFTNASKNLLKDTKELSKALNIPFNNAGTNNICLYKRAKIVKYINEIGFSNNKHLSKVRLWCSLDHS
jgi:intein/homing endonuclease